MLRGQQSFAGIGISHVDDLLAKKMRPGMHVSLRFMLMLLKQKCYRRQVLRREEN